MGMQAWIVHRYDYQNARVSLYTLDYDNYDSSFQDYISPQRNNQSSSTQKSSFGRSRSML